MSYDKPYSRPWAPKDASGYTPTPISPTALDKIDKGILDAHAELDGRLSEEELTATIGAEATDATGRRIDSIEVLSASETKSVIAGEVALPTSDTSIALNAAYVALARGLDPTGVRDCGADLQAIIDADAAKRRRTILPNGIYNMGTTALGFPQGTDIEGMGAGPNRFAPAGILLKWSASMTGTAATVNAGNVRLRNVTLDGSGSVANGLMTLGGFECRYDTVRVIRFAGAGHYVRAISNTDYNKFYVDNCGSSTRAAWLIDSVSHSLNTLDMSGAHIERSAGVALQIGPTSLTGTSDIVPEFLRIYGLHIEAVTDNGGVPNSAPLVLITLGRAITFIAPYLFGGSGVLMEHNALTAHAANAVLGGIQIIGGQLLGNSSPNRPTNLIQLTAGNEFSVIGTRFDECSGGAINVSANYGDKVFISPETVFTSRVGSAKTDARTVFDSAAVTRNPVRIQGHLHLNATAKTSPSVSTALAGSTGAPTFVAGSSDMLGGVKFGSGTAPAAGQIMFHVTFSTQYNNAPMVLLTPNNNDTRLLGLYVVRTASGFDVYAGNAPAASQPATQFEVTYMVVGVTS